VESGCARIYIANVHPMNTINTNTNRKDFLDILFEGRNKDYGAYALRRTEDRRVRAAILGTASIALVIIAGYAIDNKLKASDMPTRKPITAFDHIAPISLPPDEATPPPPPPPALKTPPPPAASSITFTPPKIVNNEVDPADVPPKMEDIGNKTVATTTTEGSLDGSDLGVPDGYGKADAIVEAPKGNGNGNGETPFGWVEIMPSFPGGEEALAKFLQKNMRYPRVAQENEIEGNVFVTFVVDKEGNISNIKTVGAAKGGGLEEEAMRVVKLMPRWKPGKQNGQPVFVQFNLPIRFHLEH
jgi:periplasmic protein TonB